MASLFDPFIVGAEVLKSIPGIKKAVPVRFITHLPVYPGPNALRSVFQRGHDIWKWSKYKPKTVLRAKEIAKRGRLKLLDDRDSSTTSDGQSVNSNDAFLPAISLMPKRLSKDDSDEKSPISSTVGEPLLDEDEMPFFPSNDDEEDLDAKRVETFTNEQIQYWRACEKFKVRASTTILKQVHKFEMQLKGIAFSDLEFKALTTSLLTNYTIKRLELNEIPLTGQQVTYLTDYISENNNISDLIMSNCNLEFRFLRRLFEEIALKDILVYLDISGNCFRNKDIPYFAEYFQNSNSLVYLYMANNQFTEDAGELLGKIFGSNSSLKDLDVSRNRIRADGTMAFFKQLLRNNFLERLDFSWNGIGEDGSKMLAALLKANSSLFYINLQGTRITGTCLELMIAGLVKNTTLERLELSHNPLLISDVSNLLTALYQNPTTAMRRIDLGNNFAVSENEVPLLDILFWEKNIDVRYGLQLKFSKQVSKAEEAVTRFREDPLALVTRLSSKDRMKLVRYFAKQDFDTTMETGEDIPIESFLHRVRHNKVTFKDLALRIKKAGSNPLDTIQTTIELVDAIESDTPQVTRFSITSAIARRMSLKAKF